jgi:hypothetical protein
LASNNKKATTPMTEPKVPVCVGRVLQLEGDQPGAQRDEGRERQATEHDAGQQRALLDVLRGEDEKAPR